ncbi:MAG: polysaccharide pyruvyl transferase family protein [Eubacteriales bacterium]|nr:polysaccharide pyruvyl transferase family protein [Eubacteriales bacterium]
MNKKRVGVITFHNYDNYGAILQSYALQKKLRELGTHPEIIDYRCDYISNPFRLVNLRKKGLFNYIYGAIGHICYIPRRRRCNQFRRLMRYSKPVTARDMSPVSGKYDLYLAGSDQIWDHKLTNFDKTYFLDFVKKGKKKCSYAASIGENLPPQQYLGQYQSLLQDFDHILVREDYGADIVEELTHKRPEVVCDPTLLLTAEEWNQLLEEPKTKKKYILVYQLGINKEIVDFTRRLQKRTGCKVIYIPFPLVGLLKCSCKIAIGPAQWMGLFKHAEYVVSDSFHGIVYALLFNRRFFAMVNGHHMNRRVQQLLKMVDLSHRTIENVPEEALTSDIDFSYANQRLEEFRQYSLEQLKKVVDDCSQT